MKLIPAMLAAAPVCAQTTLTLGISAAPGSVDPHFNQGTSTQTLTYHVFETLVDRRPDYSPGPGLAVSWQPVSETVWEIRLRPDVRFSDGQPFTADDVAFTFARVPNVPNAVVSYAGQIRAITRVEVVDPLTLRLHTDGPAPSLPIDISAVAIVSRHAGEGATTEDYNALRAAIGTGPFILRSHAPGTEAELVRNEMWWGERPDWDRVSFKYIPNAGARSAALLSGSVGILVVGYLRDHGSSYGKVIGCLAIGQLLAAYVAFRHYPETAHLELEQLNPEDPTILPAR